MPRLTKHDYLEPGSLDRIREAGIALADAETNPESDAAFARADARLRQAVNGYVRRVVERLTTWQSKGGRSRWANVSPEARSEAMRRVRAAATSKHVSEKREGVEADNG